ncbi:hypothetical protein HBI25_157480 [Parastagonospora nodorum]|nr:hypothetical protein HBH52_181550 [Parastagonospora nodorum]KAH4101227.1 hypothetical protein HBH46_144200 [Parastagonospora nodorum]KAH4698658.1 hypothetical protein HBH67_170410 [Parastagonospora nodorum]KAH4766286.1 hypothetical protein HBH63_176810 [Parastagonospora nodorum]KAH4903049.1 hypothetical protein HBH74_182400 [Parastagonospora nodorum]
MGEIVAAEGCSMARARPKLPSFGQARITLLAHYNFPTWMWTKNSNPFFELKTACPLCGIYVTVRGAMEKVVLLALRSFV